MSLILSIAVEFQINKKKYELYILQKEVKLLFISDKITYIVCQLIILVFLSGWIREFSVVAS